MLVVFEGLLASLPSQQVASFAFFGIQTLAAVAMIIRKASLLSGCFFLIETNASSDGHGHGSYLSCDRLASTVAT